jgi:hypothetical protein
MVGKGLHFGRAERLSALGQARHQRAFLGSKPGRLAGGGIVGHMRGLRCRRDGDMAAQVAF